jgi:hypothetical protein
MRNIWQKSSANLSLRPLKRTRPVRLRARTPPFHGGDTGSNPVRATKPLQENPVSTIATGFFISFERRLKVGNHNKILIFEFQD